LPDKNNKIPEFYTIFARKMPDYIIRLRDRGQAEAKTSRPRPKFWPRGHFGPEDLTSLLRTEGRKTMPHPVRNLELADKLINYLINYFLIN